MGTTLSNGVYLPDEGERNCYAGLKVNWEILNQKVADISALQLAIAGALHRQIVASLPTTDIDPNTIYMILSGTSATENVYNEFMYVNNAWELIGTSATDLTNYYTKAEVDGKLLLKANASDLTSHTGDTTIHVTASDKTKWTNSANTHVLRLAKSALTPSSSTNAFSNLDDSTALKVGDKVMDTAGVLFEVTAIDTANSTFTIGTALIDLAQDSNVVHKSGNETVAGQKTLVNLLPLKGEALGTEASNNARSLLYFLANRDTQDQSGIFLTKFRQNKPQGSMTGNDIAYVSFDCLENSVRTNNGLRINFLNFVDDIPQRFILWSGISERLLGAVGAPWSGVYATNYYYGNDNVEFSTKFVTTDTAQSITATKTFDGVDVNLKSNNAEYKVTSGYKDIFFLDKNSTRLAYFRQGVYSSGLSHQTFNILGYDSNNQQVSQSITFSSGNLGLSTAFLRANTDNAITLGDSTHKWSDVETNKVNGLEPSSLSLPSGTLTDSIDISSYFANTGTGDTNSYTAPANGWIYLRLGDLSGCQATVLDANNNRMWGQTATGNVEQITIPILKGQTLSTQWATGSSVYVAIARFIPCQGNV